MKNNITGVIAATSVLAFTLILPPLNSSAAEPPLQFQKNGFNKSAGNIRVSRDLMQLEQQYSEYLATPEKGRISFAPASALMRVNAGYIVVDAIANDDAIALESDLLGLGAVDIQTHKGTVSARLPMTSISALGDLDSLRFVRPFYAETRVGDTTSQGDVAQLSDQLRTTAGVDGTGVKVGVLSDSYDCIGGAAADVTSGDLPAGVLVIQDESGCSSGSDEGRAMLQLVHDVAPGAALSFHTAFSGIAGFANGIDALALDIQNNNAGVGVIVDDVIYFSEPMFQDGVIGQAADNAVLAGIPYYSSAGNSAKDSYESPFVDSGILGVNGGPAHDFDPGPGVDVLQEINVPIGGGFTMSFQWNQPFFSVSGAPGAATDLDIYIIGANGATLLAGGNDFNIGSDAVEVLSFTNGGFDLDGVPGLDTRFFVLIESFSGPPPTLIKYAFSGSGSIVEFDTASATAYGHAASELSQAVGAAAYFETPEFGQSPPLLEGFSSRGGIPTYFTTTGVAIDPPDYRPKPEIVAPDGTNNTFFGSDFESDGFPNFFGTSAAAPHAAGVAALLLSVDSSRTPAEINGGLRDSTVEMGPSGFDEDTGSGLIDAFQANDRIQNEAPDLDPIPSQRGVTGETLVFDLDTTTNPVSDGEGVTFSADNLPTFCSAPVNDGDGTGSISCTIGASDTGRFAVVARATDDGAFARTDIEGFYILANENSPPVLTNVPPQSVDENQQVVINIASTDPQSQPLTLSVNSPPAFCVPLNDNGDGSGSLTCNPTFTDAGEYRPAIVTTDNGVPNMADSQVILFTVNDVNRVPVLTPISDQTMDEGQQLVIPLSATDDDTDNNPSFGTSGLPGFCVLNDNFNYSGNLTCNPGGFDAGVYNITVTINDNAPVNGSDSDPFQLTVNDVNLVPVLDPIGNQGTSIGQVLVIPLSANDPDGNNLSFSDSGLPGFCVPTDNGDGTGDITCSPTTAGQIATYPVSVTVTDDGSPNESDSEAFDIVISNVNQAPIIDPINNLPVVQNENSIINVNASDPDGNSLTLTANLPQYCGLADNGDGTGVISCSPGINDSGTFNAWVTAADDGVPNLDATELFDIQVTDRFNVAPVLIPIGNQSVAENDPLVIALSAADDIANTLVFSSSALPAFCDALVDNGNGTGSITCNPTGGDEGTYAVTVTVTDDGTPWVPGSNTPPLSNNETFDIIVTGVIDPTVDYQDEAAFLAVAGGSANLIDFEGYAAPGNFEYFGDPGNFNEQGVAFANNSQMFIQNNDVYGTDSFLSPQGADPHIVVITVPAGIRGVGFSYQSAAATIQVNGADTFNMPAVTPGTLGFIGVVAGVDIVTLTVTVSGPGIDIDNFYFFATPVNQIVDQDTDGDGKSDILLRNNVTGANQLYIMDGRTISQNLGVSSVSADWQVIGRGDYDGDGNSDILWRFTPTGAVWIYFMDGNSILSSQFVGTVSDSNWKVVGNGDYNGDGKSDILWRLVTTGTVWLYEMDGSTVTNSTGIGVVPDSDWQIVGSGDYNGDGKSDILWRNVTSGTNWMYLMNGPAITTNTGISVTPDLNWEIVGNGDHDGDGKSDILWRNSVSGTNWLYLMDGTTISTSGSISVLPDSNWIVVGDGDHSGDGKADVLWRNLSTGSNYMYLMDGFSIADAGTVSVVTDQNWQIVNTR